MKLLTNIFSIFLFFYFYHSLYILFGFIFYFISKRFRSPLLLKVSISLIALGFAPFFGAFRLWISKHCPDNNCKKCLFWTCAGKEV